MIYLKDTTLKSLYAVCHNSFLWELLHLLLLILMLHFAIISASGVILLKVKAIILQEM